jgi:DNA-binding NtrC family response regulator
MNYSRTDVSSLPVVLVDDEPQVLRSASIVLRTSGVPNVMTLEDSRAVMALLAKTEVGVLVLDLTMPHLSGEALLRQVGQEHPDIPVIVMTASNDLQTAVRCMQGGAIDYLLKPVESSRLVSAVQRGLEMRALRVEVFNLKEGLLHDEPRQHDAFADIITQSKSMLAVFRYVEAVATSPHPVLITGESGTGKDLIAKALHRLSGRPKELVTVNVAGVDDALFCDTLFGHGRWSFTTAEREREGLITAAAQGTLFLDEIGDLAIPSQVKLLQLLQDGTYYPVGADRPKRSQARVVVATNRDVQRDMSQGKFRKDLYYRLRTHHLELPPLRSRPGDLPLLVSYHVQRAAQALNKSVPTIPTALLQLLLGYGWPGNVRELEGMCVDAVARHQSGVLSTQSFKEAMAGKPMMGDAQSAPAKGIDWPADQLPTLWQANDALIAEALQRVGGNQTAAAQILGLTRQALNRRLTRSRSGQHDSNSDE